MEYFKLLPVDITLDILIRLPADTVLNCKSVCRNWRSLIRRPSFSKMHLNRLNHPCTDSGKLTNGENQTFHYFEYIENHDESTPPIQEITRFNSIFPFRCTNFLGSCNGLICIYTILSVCVGNPITREYLVLPEIKLDCIIDYMTFGFGYVSSTDEYKVVKIHVLMTQFAQVYIYTLGSGKGWRNVGKFDSKFFDIGSWQQGIFADSALYWKDTKSEMIVTFDLAEEKFGESLSPPPMPPDYIWRDQTIWVLDGFLSFVVYPFDLGDEFYDVWLLKEGEDQSLGWTKRLDTESVVIMKSGGISTTGGNRLNIYHTKNSTSKTVVRFNDLLCQVFPHKNTLVSLKELGEEDTKTMEPVELRETKSRRDSSLKQLQEDMESIYI